MCYYSLIKILRPIKNSKKIIILKEEVFEKLISKPYISVIVTDRWDKIRYKQELLLFITKRITKIKDIRGQCDSGRSSNSV